MNTKEAYTGLYVTGIRKNKRGETILSLSSGLITPDKFRLKYYLKNPKKVEKLIKKG